MLNLASIVLTFISILKDIKKKKTLRKKVEKIKEALESVDNVYALLSQAKQSHDEFQSFKTVAQPIFDSFEEKDSLSQRQLKAKIKSFLNYKNRFIKQGELFKIDTTYNLKAAQSELGVDTAMKIKDVNRVYPQYLGSFSNFHANISELETLKEKGNFGEAFTACIELIHDSIDQVTNNADQIILNICPVMDFIHLEIKRGVRELL